MRRPLLIFLASACIAAAQAPSAKTAGTFDPKNLTGKYHRETPFQTYSNVPGGANELQAFLLPTGVPQPDRKKHRKAKPHGSPKQRFAKSDDMCLPMKHAEVQPEEDYDTEDESCPVPGGDVNQRKHVTATCVHLAKNARNASPAAYS